MDADIPIWFDVPEKNFASVNEPWIKPHWSVISNIRHTSLWKRNSWLIRVVLWWTWRASQPCRPLVIVCGQ